MILEDQERAKNLRAVFEQHWLHARHVENERLWFTNIYALVVGGLLAYTYGKAEDASCSPWPWQILVVILLLSLLGLGMSHSMRIPFLRHHALTQVIQLKEWGLSYADEYKLAFIKSLKLTAVYSRRSGKFVAFSTVFHLLYISMSVFSSAFIALSFTNSYLWAVVVGVGFCVLLLVFYKFCLQRKEDKAVEEINTEFGISK